jgi:hypothetical protein
MKGRINSLAAILSVVLQIGSGPTEPKEEFLGVSAMEFGSTPDSKALAGFVIGKWGYVTGSMKPMSGAATDIMEFKQDGTLLFKKDSFKFGGTWKDMGEFVQVEYFTLQGKPIQTALEEFRKGAEIGGQGAIAVDMFSEWASANLDKMTELRLGDDQLKLVFGAKPLHAAATGNMDMDGMLNDMNAAITAMNSPERIGVKK